MPVPALDELPPEGAGGIHRHSFSSLMQGKPPAILQYPLRPLGLAAVSSQCLLGPVHIASAASSGIVSPPTDPSLPLSAVLLRRKKGGGGRGNRGPRPSQGTLPRPRFLLLAPVAPPSHCSATRSGRRLDFSSHRVAGPGFRRGLAAPLRTQQSAQTSIRRYSDISFVQRMVRCYSAAQILHDLNVLVGPRQELRD
ncbi:hypothetical protein NDU88_004846 [Pleurodeles waltl]|uniref:Uncharacterized protein n=1 Tax=Pleurodeles waltl TaxID=8319 RepID=A0AAV7VLG5_PLEWA|nr:hypothetical protein NDU88_004846 [Pleurodeles waltl]